MTPDEIDKLDGRDLDAQVAERVFGWPPSTPEAVLHYSTDPAAMMEVVGRMGDLGWDMIMRRYPSGSCEADLQRGNEHAETEQAWSLPLAVARAALKAVEGGR